MSVGTPFSYANQPISSVQLDLGGGAGGLWTPPGAAPPMNDLWLLCLRPFAFVLTELDGDDFGTDITDWTLLDEAHRFPTS